jgi:hypothetical protein
MAIEALMRFHGVFIHKPRHDLESILYIIIYLCTYMEGPAAIKSAAATPTSLHLNRWFTTDDLKGIGVLKMGNITSADYTIICDFTPYWADFVPFIREMISACFNSPSQPAEPNSLTYTTMLDILKRAYDVVQEPLQPEEGRHAKRQRDSEGKRRSLSERAKNR